MMRLFHSRTPILLRSLGATLVIVSGVAVASCEADSDESRGAPSQGAAENAAPNSAAAAAVEVRSGPAARALRAAFPEHADRVLGLHFPDGFVANEPGFGRAPSGSIIAHVDVQLPRDAAKPTTITAPGGFEIRVREIDASGEATPDERAVTYRRAGGSAFWTVNERGAEEWLHLDAGAVRSMEDVAATWEIEGAEPVLMNGAVAMMDHGVARAYMTAEEAYSKGGRKVDVRLAVRDHRVELFADAQGEEVLIDPGWVAVAPNTSGRWGATAATLLSGKVLFANGYNGATILANAEVYDPLANTWAAGGTMAAGRYLPAMSILTNGKVIVAGGQTLAAYVATAELYDPSTNTWSAAPSMSAARGIPSSALFGNGKLLVAGGYNGAAFLATAEAYDPATNTWSSAGTMATLRAFGMAVRLANGKVLVAGGENTSINTPTALASAELYDPATNTWSSAGTMANARYAGTGSLLPNGKVVVEGGLNTAGTALTATDIYDPATNTWSAGPAMAAAHAGDVGTVLPNGLVLVAAGINGAGTAGATSEIYNSATNAWSSAGNVSTARYLPGGAPLTTGDFLVIDGTATGTTPLTNVDRYYFSSLSAGSACGVGQQCASGFCVNGVCCQVAACAALDQCHTAGTCQAGTGVCSNPTKADGTACNDNSVCTPTDTCVAGTCTGQNPVVCGAQDQCHTAGVCDPATGVCSNPLKADGSMCDDGDACTKTDACSAGACLGANPVVCMASDQCHVAGVCNPMTGMCSNPNKADGATCDDGDLCTQTDSCMAGACTGNNPVVCMASDQCHVAGVCDPMTGTCDDPAKPDGAACDDGDLCTQTDACSTGVCTGGNPVVCTASDQCHDAGVCDPMTGTCDDPEKADGTACDDGDLCTQTDACSTGVCTGTNPVVCEAADDCHVAGTCDPTTGVCDDPAAPDGTPCSIGTCESGNCADTGGGGAGGTTNTGGTNTGGTTTGTGATSTGGTTDGGSAGSGDSGGCGCRVAGSEDENKTSPAAVAGLALAALTWARRRRPRRSPKQA